MNATLLADRLIAARRRDFVGRLPELELFESVLTDGTGAAVYVHGPGGIGKTSLLHQYEWLGGRHGRRVVRCDVAEAGQSAGAVLAGLARAAGLDPAVPAGAAVSGLAALPGLLLLLDGVELLVPLDRWLREEVLAGLAADAIVVLAGRTPPALGWRTDPGWRDMLRVVPLAELDTEGSREVLRRRGLSESAWEPALGFARGHPLTLALAAEIGPELAGRLGAPGAQPEALRELLSGLLDVVPGPLHRAALEASSQVLVTTEPLLAALLDQPDAHDVFGWLRELSVMAYSEHGVRPHDLVRDLLSAELRWRDPDRHAVLHRRAAGYYRRRLSDGEPVLFQFAYLHRDNPVLGPYLGCVAPDRPGPVELAVTPMSAGDWPRLHELLVRHEGPASAALADGWASPATVSVVRAADGPPVGFVLLLALETLDPRARDADPATAAAWRYLQRSAPLGAGETALHIRYWLAAEQYQGISPAQTQITLHLVRLYLTIPGLAVSFLPMADPDFWAAACGYADLHRLPDADFTVDGRTFGVYAHDWRSVPPIAWMELLAAHRTARASGPPPAAAVGALAEEEFAVEVRAAVRELGRPDRLGDTRLARCALVPPAAGGAGTPGPQRGELLEQVIRQAAKVLEGSVRDRRGYRALHHTYLQPAGTQQRSAELLDLPMSTYRRHLAEGVARLTTLLWRQELAARAGRTESGQEVGGFRSGN